MSYTIKLKDRGTSVVRCIDLFDECHYGADKLFLRGKFGTPQDVANQVKIALGDESLLDTAKLKDIYGVDIDTTFTKTKLGVGNPLEQETSESGEQTIPTIALNRYHIPNKKFWNNTPPSGIANPYKASAAVTFSIRVHFRDDFAYITFGCPWSAVMDESAETTSDEIISDMSNFALLKCHFISKDDALSILKDIVGENVIINTFNKNNPQVQETQEVLEITDENGVAISLD